MTGKKLELEKILTEIEEKESTLRFHVHTDDCQEFCNYNCNYDDIEKNYPEIIRELKHNGSNLAIESGLMSKEAFSIHWMAENYERALPVAHQLEDVDGEIACLRKLKRYEPALDIAQEHEKHNLAVDLLLDLARREEAVEYAKNHSLPEQAINILYKSGKCNEAVAYATAVGEYEKALDLLVEVHFFDEAFQHGKKYDCREYAIRKVGAVIDTILADAQREIGEEEGAYMRDEDHTAEKAERAINKVTPIYEIMAKYTLQSVKYKAKIDDLQNKFFPPKPLPERIKEYENLAAKETSFWFAVADLELCQGNLVRYRKIWRKSKELFLQRGDSQRAEEAQSYLDNPRAAYFQSQHELDPKLYSEDARTINQFLSTLQTAYLSRRKSPEKFPSLESILNSWTIDGAAEFCEYFDKMRFNDPRENKISSPLLSEAVRNLSPEQKMVDAFQTVKDTNAFDFVLEHLPVLLKTNLDDMTYAISGDDFEAKVLVPGSNGMDEQGIFFRLGEMYDYILGHEREEHQSPEERPLYQKQGVALRNLLFVPVKKLTPQNIFDPMTGGPELFWKIFESASLGSKIPEMLQDLVESYDQKQSEFLLDERLRTLMGDLNHFPYDTKKLFKDLFHRVHTNPLERDTLERALNIYYEMRRAHGKSPFVDYSYISWDSPFHFLGQLPQDEEGKNNLAMEVMKNIRTIPSCRMEVAAAVLNKPLHDFFTIPFSLLDTKKGPDGTRSETNTKPSAELISQLEILLPQFYKAAPDLLDDLQQAYLKIEAEHGAPDQKFWFLHTGNGDVLEHYKRFASAINAERSSLFIPEPMQRYVLETQRTTGLKRGIHEKMLREFDGIRYLFKEMYGPAQAQAFKERKNFRETTVREIVDFWREKQAKVLPPEVLETLAHFNFYKFFHGTQDKDNAVKTYLEKGGGIEELEYLFENQANLLLSHIQDVEYYDMERRKAKLSDGFINAINRLRNGLSSSWSFDEFRVEFNKNKLDDFFNNAAECTGNQGKYQWQGYGQMQDRNIGIIAANIYESYRHKSTVGKAFLARCQDSGGKELLYVDGVVMLQDIADFLAEPTKEARWMPMYTKAILQTALTHKFDEVVFNVSHKLAQRSVWQYIRHLAELISLQEGRDFQYQEGLIDDSSKNGAVNTKTMSDGGFELTDRVVEQNYHYVEKIVDAGYNGEHLLEGFWINHWDCTQVTGKGPRLPTLVKPVDHREVPQVNDGRGHIIGFRWKTEELVKLFREKYGKEYALAK
ncbi:hypothetical protein HYU22_05635 [Candidatus Woesearchaeota archaeon]|nr:hypothetical protein [Candidatus Woesearchaeota archaeon]